MANNVTVYVVSAICGNFWQESGINPGVWENLSAGTWTDLLKGYGLGQWTNTQGNTHGRLYQLHDYLQSNGYADDSFDGELAFIEYENVWYRQAEAAQFQNLQDFLSSQSTDLTMLTHAWNMGWEGIHDSSWNQRVTNAFNVCDYIQNNYDPITYQPWWWTGNRYLSNQERYDNAMYMYHLWNGGSPAPVPPTPPSVKRGMPLFMYLPRIIY